MELVRKIKAHTINQIKIVDTFENNDMVFAIGPGTGKTYADNLKL